MQNENSLISQESDSPANSQALALLGAVSYFQNPDMQFTHIGDGFEEVFEFSSSSLLHQPHAFRELLLKSDRSQVLNKIQSIATAKPQLLKYCLHNPAKNTVVYVEDVRTAVFDQDGELMGYRGILHNNSRQAVAEQRLAHTAWKEHLAVVTSGLIHDFNNIMAGIFSLSELYYDKMGEDHPMAEGVGQIKKNAYQAQTLCRRIIDLNREDLSGPSYHNLETLLNDQIDLIKASLRKGTKIETSFTGKEIPVYLDDVLFRQVILNLGINARDVLPKKGRIEIAVRTVESNEAVDLPEGREYVEIVFADNGSGIAKENQAHIFDPFFTTKQTTKGSGFGLYNAKLFFQNNGGLITLSSAPGEGARFSMYLPIADFNEQNEEGDNEHESSSTRRPSVMVYSCVDPESLEITSLMRSKQWEVISFNSVQTASSYLAESVLPPQIALAVDIGHDDRAAQLLDSISHLHPNIQTALQVIGRNPDILPENLTRRVDLLLKDDIPDTQIIQELSLIIPQ